MRKALLISLLLPVAAFSQVARPPIPGVALETAPKIDGIISPSEWPDTAKGSGFYDRDTGSIADENAEFWLAYDKNYIYFAARAFTDPNKLIDVEFRPLAPLGGNDNFSLSIDLNAQGRTVDVFSINPRGATNISLSGGRAAKTEWIGEFDAKSRRTETGWETEARIPWSILSAIPAGQRNARFNVTWYRSNRANTYSYSYTRGDDTFAPLWTGINVPAIQRSQRINVLPYFVLGAEEGEQFEQRAGLDAKTTLANGLQAVMTVNPDDRNIDADVLGLDFSYFERLAGESRPFFQEGSRFFGFGSGLFASQRIRNIDTGFKLYGDLTPQTSLGFLSTADFGEQNVNVLRLGQRINRLSSASFLLVNNNQSGTNNNSVNVSYNTRIGTGFAGLSYTLTDDQQRGTGESASISYGNNSQIWEYGFFYSYVTPTYFPRVGFAPERNFRRFGLDVGYGLQNQKGFLRDWSIGAGYGAAERFNTGESYRRDADINLRGTLRNKVNFRIGYSSERFEQNDDRSFSVRFSFPDGNPYQNVSVSHQQALFDGDPYRSYGIGYRVRPFPNGQLSLSNEFVNFRGNRTQQILSYTQDIGIDQGVSIRVIRRNNDINFSGSYRLSGRRGNEFFLIIGDPGSREFTQRIALKVLVPITFGN